MSDTTVMPDAMPVVVVTLLKGALHRDRKPEVWQELMGLQNAVRDYVAVLGLQLLIDETEGYAFLRSIPTDPDDESDGPTVPRLMVRRALTFEVSLLLVLLRKKLAEFDGGEGTDSRLVMSRQEIIDMVTIFLPSSHNEAKLLDKIDRYLSQITDLGFVRPLRQSQSRSSGSDAESGGGPRYEVERIIKAYIDAQWVDDFAERLAEYRDRTDESSNTGGGDE